ncbi:hypothetical protein LZ198_06335 [Myxococcus sp. K15C18031901]|uniref:hypothetical protein n=1 Tax=Myxococcus dinghuensis TaxID=2906761 RepID=UPI0020A7C5B0|nr:hypothetical protein [Myxococcus dinghuensis]MCP3098494.1 hypothetical protein [Myxococcus dinghuensis]
MKLIVPLLFGALVACSDSDSGPVTVTPKTVTVKAGEKTTFSASVKDAKDPRILWSVEGGDSHGTISSAGIYTAPAQAGTYTVVATNAVDTSKKDTATVKVEAVQTPTVIVKVSPEVVTIGQGTVANFAAEVSGSSITAVQWSVEGGDENGTISSTGRYTAPDKAGTFTVTATSVADPTKTGSATVTVEPVVVGEVQVAVSPSSASTTWDGTVQLTAEVTGTNNLAVQWSVEGGDENGYVSSTGVYRAPKKTGTFTVTATSVADSTKKASASIKVDPVVVEAVVVTVSPKTGTVVQDGSFALSAQVTGTNILAVQWSVEGGDENGTISSTGVYRAPRRAGTYTVTATSVADSSKHDSAVITVPVASTVNYVDPTGTGWRLVRNASLSSGDTLVLDLVGPTGQSGRGADLTLGLDAATASWSTVDGSEYVANGGYDLGAAPHLFKSGVKGTTLSVGVYQKGAPARAYDGALLSVALTVTTIAETPAGTAVPLKVIKAHALPASGSLQAIDVAVGTITTAQ